MDEKKINAQLLKIMAATIASSIVLTLIGFFVIMYVLSSAHDAEHSQMKAEADEYKTRILKQLDNTTQILKTLSKEYEISDIMDDPQRLQLSIQAANSANDFIGMLYIGSDGGGYMNTPSHGNWTSVTLQDLHPFAVEAIEKAQQGENAVSKMFDSDVYNGKLFVYAVPVYRDGQVVGVLAASDTMEIFSDIANGDTVMGGRGYIHLISDTGEFLVRSCNTLVKENLESIYDGPFLSEQTHDATQLAMANGESTYGEFTYKGDSCHFYITPLGMNGWYLFCANSFWDSLQYIGKIIFISCGLMVLLVVMVNVILYNGYGLIRKNQRKLLHIAYTDALTSAENTLRFDRRFAELEPSPQTYSIVAVNIHNFKGINDLFGKEAGDQVLRYLKTVFDQALHEDEFFCRDAGDLFYLFLRDTDETVITTRLRKIIDDISEQALNYSVYSYDLSLYVGVAIGEDREKALLALQSIQHVHHKDIAFYNSEMHEDVRRKINIESQMASAIQNKEFKLFLQPKFELSSGRLVGAEALVRWHKPDGSCYYPSEFVPLFESNGFCLKLDEYMLERVCEKLQEWTNAGAQPVPVSVNQSKLTFSDLKYADNLSAILARYGVSPSSVTLEVLEGVASDDLEFLNRQIEALHAKGFHVSMDDFGSGYSSLNMLYQLKIDELKLDRGFLREASEEECERRKIILKYILRYAKTVGITTVAEGIETAEDRDTVLELDCDIGQGYFYEKPIPAEEFTQRYMNPNG